MTERTHTGQCPGPGKLLGAEESVLITFKSVKKNMLLGIRYYNLKGNITFPQKHDRKNK